MYQHKGPTPEDIDNMEDMYHIQFQDKLPAKIGSSHMPLKSLIPGTNGLM
jgi:hypothetical protein